VDIWWGESDRFSSPIVGQRMASMIPDSRLRLEGRAGHLILFTHWQAILESLIAA